MKLARRTFLKTTGVLGVASLLNREAVSAAAEASFVSRPPKMKLGLVTYNIAKDWDVPTLIKNCRETKLQGVELRTTHAHGVEVTLPKEQRQTVKQQFLDSGIELMGLGSAYDYHTPDPKKL